LLRVDQYEFIRTAHRVYGKSISELSRLTGHSRNTVRKALRGEPWGYRERKKQPFPVLGPYLEIIDGWLKADKGVPKKQRHTACRIYNRLVEEHGYQGGESTVRRYVSMARMELGVNSPGAFIPCDPEAGFEAEVDWGTAMVEIEGKRHRVRIFCMRSKYSGKHFVRAYPCERQQAFFDAHIRGFQFFGGVFPVLIYDNLTTAVRKVLRGRNRVEQESFRRFRAYHSFEARFANPSSGNEKGGVEGLVGFSRRNYLVPIPSVKDFSELNKNLLDKCLAYGGHTISGRRHTVEELFEQEKGQLIPLPGHVFSNQLTLRGKVDKYGTVIVDKNRYSVPTSYVGRSVNILLGVNKVSISVKGKGIAEHDRLYGNNKWQLDPDHYLDLLHRRPMAFESARPIRQWRDSWPVCYEKLLKRFQEKQGETRGIKDFITVLMLHRDYEASEVKGAVELAFSQGISSSEGVRHLLIYTNDSPVETPPLEGWDSIASADVSQYGQLGGVQ